MERSETAQSRYCYWTKDICQTSTASLLSYKKNNYLPILKTPRCLRKPITQHEIKPVKQTWKKYHAG